MSIHTEQPMLPRVRIVISLIATLAILLRPLPHANADRRPRSGTNLTLCERSLTETNYRRIIELWLGASRLSLADETALAFSSREMICCICRYSVQTAHIYYYSVESCRLSITLTHTGNLLELFLGRFVFLLKCRSLGQRNNTQTNEGIIHACELIITDREDPR